MTLDLIPGPWWRGVRRCDRRAVALADRHYSRQTPGAVDALPPGRVLMLLGGDAEAVWGVCENLDPAGARRWRVTLFRREGGPRASDQIREATAITADYWRRHYGALPGVPLTTEVDARRTRRKRDPGRCFVQAGWRRAGVSASGLVVLEAPI